MPEHIVGKHPDGWLVVEMRLETMEGLIQTVEHEEVRGRTRFAASGSIWPRRDSPDCVRGGQCLDELWATKPVGPWTETDLLSLWAIWTRWHLNDMRMACAHQHVLHESSRGYDQPDLKRTKPCYSSGYKLGTAWLYEPVPEHVITEIHRLASLLTNSEAWPNR